MYITQYSSIQANLTLDSSAEETSDSKAGASEEATATETESEISSSSSTTSSGSSGAGAGGATALSSPSSTSLVLSDSSSSTGIAAEASATGIATENGGDSENANQNTNKSAFFSDKGKVAGTFTAVGVVVLGIASAILYCCCCCGAGAARRRSKSSNDIGDEFISDEENRYSSDESVTHEKTVVRPPNAYSKHSSFSSLKRDNSSKTLFSLFNGGADREANNYSFNGHVTTMGSTGGAGVNRNLSRKKLMSRRNSTKDSPSLGGSSGGLHHSDGSISGGPGVIFPIDELDNRLDFGSMFLNTIDSNKLFGDGNDYSRKLKITNPDS